MNAQTQQQNAETATVPEGYRQDAKGRLVPEDQIKPVDALRDELVLQIVDRAIELRDELADYKADTFSEIEAFVSTSAQDYGVQLGGKKGNVQLLSYDGQYKVVRAMQDLITFDERLQSAKALIDECLKEWTADARSEVIALIQDAFQVDQAGNIRTGEVLRLRRLDIKDPRWLMAMDAIADAIQVTGSKSYIRIYKRDEHGRYQPISLNLAEV